MPSTAVDIGAVILLILPGFLAYRFAVARRADPVSRSPLWQLSEILEYSVYVHLIGVGIVFGILGLLNLFGVNSHLSELPGNGPDAFLSIHFVEGTLLFTLYPAYVIVAASIIGAYDLPNRLNDFIVTSTTIITRRSSSKRFLRWIPTPSPAYPKEPIWYYAFHGFTNGFREAQPLLLIKMKAGDIYYGELVSYPVLPDDEKNKDFLIRKARYYPNGDLEQEYRLEEQDNVGAVLLNTADVDSIQVYYNWASQSPEEIE